MSAIAIATLKSLSPIQFGRMYCVEKNDKEQPAAYEIRTWRERAHYDEKGMLFIPPMCFKKSLEGAAAFLSMQIKGRGKATYTKHFLAGVLVMDPVPLPVHKDRVRGLWLNVPHDGRRGGRSRVPKCFPVVDLWEGQVTYHILDGIITEPIFTRHLIEAGNFIGILSFRAERGGYFGRYEVKNVKWQEN